MSLYDDLGVGKDASLADIRSAYRKRAMDCHPDLGGDRDEFERIQNAYDVLSNAELRARYDETGETAAGPDNNFSEVSQIVIAAFDHVVAQAGAKFQETDLITATCTALRAQKKGLLDSIANAAAERTKLEDILERLKFAGSGPDILSGTLRQRIRSYESGIAAAERKAEQIDEATAYLGAYGFQWQRAELSSRPHEEIDFDKLTLNGLANRRR